MRDGYLVARAKVDKCEFPSCYDLPKSCISRVFHGALHALTRLRKQKTMRERYYT